MAVSETRGGPGWWMDRDGGWNPPELWPETTPPLPGWIQIARGRWQPPAEAAAGGNAHEGATSTPMIDLTQPDPAQSHAVHTPRHAAIPEDTPEGDGPEKKPSLNLGFAQPQAETEPALVDVEQPTRRWGRVALAIAGLIALLVVVLLVL